MGTNLAARLLSLANDSTNVAAPFPTSRPVPQEMLLNQQESVLFQQSMAKDGNHIDPTSLEQSAKLLQLLSHLQRPAMPIQPSHVSPIPAGTTQRPYTFVGRGHEGPSSYHPNSTAVSALQAKAPDLVQRLASVASQYQHQQQWHQQQKQKQHDQHQEVTSPRLLSVILPIITPAAVDSIVHWSDAGSFCNREQQIESSIAAMNWTSNTSNFTPTHLSRHEILPPCPDATKKGSRNVSRRFNSLAPSASFTQENSAIAEPSTKKKITSTDDEILTYRPSIEANQSD